MSEWISVKDRLPETEVFIYAEIRRDNKVIGYVVTAAIYEDGTIHTDDTRNLKVDDFVTHWMPLPKPPKES